MLLSTSATVTTELPPVIMMIIMLIIITITIIILVRGRCVGTLVTSSGMQRKPESKDSPACQCAGSWDHWAFNCFSFSWGSKWACASLVLRQAICRLVYTIWMIWAMAAMVDHESWPRVTFEHPWNILRFLARSLEMLCGRSTLTERLLFNMKKSIKEIPWITLW